VCGENWDCPHCLLEWCRYPSERLRGVLWPMVDRMQDILERLLVECSLAEVPPRDAALQAAYEAGRAMIEWSDEEAAKNAEDEANSSRASDAAEIDRNDIRDAVGFGVRDFVMGAIRRVPGVTTVVLAEPVSTEARSDQWFSLWAADPVAVRQHLLDLLTPLEVQLDQFYFERGERPPTVRQTEEPGSW
jgi:hypothetical protein